MRSCDDNGILWHTAYAWQQHKHIITLFDLVKTIYWDIKDGEFARVTLILRT